MISKVSVRWQTVIPRDIRERLGIEPDSYLDWEIKDGVIHVHPVPADPVRSSLGMFRDEPFGTEELLAERQRERQEERRAEAERGRRRDDLYPTGRG
jgi:AbrB family looped-hinge helix DNA binding protein